MFRTFAKASLRRSLHTSTRAAAPARPARFRTALGASAVAASYFLWSSWNHERIALDAPSSSSKQVPLTPKSSTSPEAIAHSPSTAAQHEPSLHTPPKSSPGDTPAPEGDAAPSPQIEEGESSGGSGGAFNPETGEINWDCPCLGGMAHGPCGMQFREAFSCFVFSEAEPKGIDCVEKFKAMQECFREHPDVYGEDIMDDDEELPSTADAAPSAETAEIPTQPASPSPEAEAGAASSKKSKPRTSTAASA